MVQLTLQQAFNLALQDHQAGRLQEAEQRYRQILAQQPDHVGAIHYLGVLSHQQGRNDAAIDLIRRAIALSPGTPEAHNNLGLALKANGQLNESIAAYQQALALRPNYASALYNLGIALQSNGQIDQAITAYRQTIALMPDNANACYNLGDILREKGQLHEAIAAFRQAITINPCFADAHRKLGIALQGIGNPNDAIACYRQAVALNPQDAAAYSNLGTLLADSGDLDESIAALDQALALSPNSPQILSNLAAALSDRGQLDEAIATLRRSIAAAPDQENTEAFTNLLFALYHHPDSDSIALLTETRDWATRQRVLSIQGPLDRNTKAGRKLRVGYLSPFFYKCSDAHFIIPLLSNHDRTRFEIYCYSATVHNDPFTEQLKPCADHWTDILQMKIDEASALIRKQEIDVLVTMSSPADRCKQIVASRVAPVQVVWMTFASCTTGLATVDYRISDSYIDPIETDETSYSEKTIRLPETAWCYDPLVDSALAMPLASPNRGEFTFGSLNRFCKINPPVLATWADILKAVPHSRMEILAVAGSARGDLLDKFQRLGIAPSRITFVDRRSREEYLRQYQSIDVMLDTFPYSGHTTAFDSLWMGVPVVTLLGETCVGRVAASALQNLGLSELIGRTPKDYVRIAVDLANDPSRLKQLHATLRERMQSSALMDAPKFARNMEAAYRRIWRTWCETAPSVQPDAHDHA